MPDVMFYKDIVRRAPILFWHNTMQDLGLKIEGVGRAVGDYARFSPASNEAIILELRDLKTLINKRLRLLEASEEE
jgi:hypothetical protein